MFIHNPILFWVLVAAGSTAAGYWLAVRPAGGLREFATPVSVLVLILAVLLCMLVITGTTPTEFISNTIHLIASR